MAWQSIIGPPQHQNDIAAGQHKQGLIVLASIFQGLNRILVEFNCGLVRSNGLLRSENDDF